MIPFIDLHAQYLSLKPEIDAAVFRVLDSGRYASGQEVAAFEREFAAFCGVGNAVGVNSGTSALHLALLAAGIGPGDEVITVPLTFVATVAAIVYTGARPVFVDIDPVLYTMDPRRIEPVITNRTKALLPVHLYGQPADMDPILDFASRHRLVVIEDACQAHAAEYKGRRAGSIGHLGCFSFYPAKNLGACGEAGLVITNNPEYEHKIRMLRDWGTTERYHHDVHGFNSRMDELQAAILRVKLPHLEAWTESRRRHASEYARQLASVNVELPTEAHHARHVYHVYPIQCRQRDDVRNWMQRRGTETGIHYPMPVHLQKAYATLGYRAGDFPEAERVAAQELSLPIFPELSGADIGTVCSELREASAFI